MTITFLPLLNLLDRAPWTEESLCSKSDNPDAWFPVSPPKSNDAAILTCHMCPVIGQCAAEAISAKETWGIRAGVFHSGDSRAASRKFEALRAIAESRDVKIPEQAIADQERKELVGMAAVNAARTHCKHGHEFTEESTGYRKESNGVRYRYCRTCHQERHRKTAEQKAASA